MKTLFWNVPENFKDTIEDKISCAWNWKNVLLNEVIFHFFSFFFEGRQVALDMDTQKGGPFKLPKFSPLQPQWKNEI